MTQAEFTLPRHARSIGWRIWILCILTYACFYTPYQNSNVTTRLGLASAMVIDHNLYIDRFAPFTIDKAEAGDHFYADKAPGLSVLTLPEVGAATTLGIWSADTPILDSHLVDGNNPYTPELQLLAYLGTLFTVGLLTATAAAVLFRWCLGRGASVSAATLVALAYPLGSLTFLWSTILFGHAAAGALLMLGFVSLSTSFERARRGVDRAALWLAALGGFCLGLGFAVDFTCGPAVAIVAIVCGVEALVRKVRFSSVAAVYIASLIGLIIPLLPLGWYNAAAFGSPFKLGYGSVQGFAGMKTGFFGVSLPSLNVAKMLLIGQYRGLLPLSPELWPVPFGFLIAIRRPNWWPLAVTAVLVFAWYLAMNSGYYYWFGGDSTGPRHLIPVLPFLIALLAPLWDASGRIARMVIAALVLVSAAACLTLTALTVTSPESQWSPLTTFWLPMLRDGHLQRLVGNVVGLHGILGLVPVLAIWLIVGLPLIRLVWRSITPPQVIVSV